MRRSLAQPALAVAGLPFAAPAFRLAVFVPDATTRGPVAKIEATAR